MFHIINVETITTHPTNVTVCLTENTTATFTCVVDRGGTGITTANWHILVGGRFIPTLGRDRHMSGSSVTGDTLTDTLTVTNVSVNDNGTLYRCEPSRTVFSNNVTLTVLGEIAYNLSLSMIVLDSRDQYEKLWLQDFFTSNNYLTVADCTTLVITLYLCINISAYKKI